MKIEGGCYCGALRYQVEGDPLFKGQCHCRECQYISGGSVNVTMGMPEAGFSYTKGSPAKFERSDLEKPVTREFCALCGTHIASRPPGLPAVLLDGTKPIDVELVGITATHHTTAAGGGFGAVRECCDLLLHASGLSLDHPLDGCRTSWSSAVPF